ncbi:hypothetical protein PCNPT3_06255 [Psychromonas sp. CNPT3]|uniref:three component ABC system middle component n=1 Tax=Psychromonas sp. CNPT3 TaxID=314282 RepID=UPI00006E9CEF|nr:three component ABC system middle component [Psychromonas sp. CNPT3]AGH81191.1 hypothetical protein PCNPT3_06255 [Psychromonas sp. CNPT3]
MSSVIDALYQLKYNPFKYGEYLTSFYSSLENLENNFLLAQLVIPLCSHPFFANKLRHANNRSSLWSIFDDRTSLYDLQERMDEFKGLTEQSIRYCLINDWLVIDHENLTLRYSSDAVTIPAIQKNAVNLGKLISSHSVVETYAFLGVKPR